MEEEGIRLPLRSLKCNYYHPSFYEDEIIVKTRTVDLTPTRITFYYEVIRRGSLKPIVTGETEHIWVNNDLKPINMRKYKPDLFNMIQAIYNEEGSA